MPPDHHVGRLPIAVFLTSLSLIAMQIALMQALAQAQGSHFAFLVISLALLGFGSSGTVVALTRRWLLKRWSVVAPGCLLVAGLGGVPGMLMALFFAARTDFPLLFADPRAWQPLILSAVGAFIPFFWGALFLALVFTRDVVQIGARYAANLLGSATGAGVGLLVLLPLHPENAVFALLIPLLVGGWLIRPPGLRWMDGLFATALIVVGGAFMLRPDMPMSAYKPIQYSLRLPDARIQLDKPHPMGRIQIVSSPALRHGPGMSLLYSGEIPAVPHLYRNGDPYGVLLDSTPGDQHLYEASIHGLPLALATPARALILQAGAGQTVDYLLHQSISGITAVEPHPIVANILRSRYEKDRTGGRLKIETADPRAWLSAQRKEDGAFDLIHLPSQGGFGGGVGLQAMQEDYLLTVESFRALWQRLTPDGLVSVSLWVDQPPRQSLRLLATLIAAMRAEGTENPSAHIMAVRSWDMIQITASREPFTARHRESQANFSRQYGFDRIWIPMAGPSPDDGFHQLDDTRLDDGFAAILEGSGEAFAREYPFFVNPTTDERPYFHQFIRWNRLDDLRRIYGDGALPYVEMGSIVVGITFLALGCAAFLLILIPLVLQTEGTSAVKGPYGFRFGRVGVFFYFAAIGLGFMFLEIAWIQRLTLYWGHPLYSAAGVITALLSGMGLGSALSRRLPDHPLTLRWVIGGILGFVLLSLVIYPWIFALTLSNGMLTKSIIGLTLIGLPAILLGMPFPLGLRALGNTATGQVPWAWGINGCFSVLAAPLSALLAMHFGFTFVGISVVAAYLLAWMVVGKPE